MITVDNTVRLAILPEIGRAIRIQNEDVARVITNIRQVTDFGHLREQIAGKRIWELFPFVDRTVTDYAHEWGFAIHKSIDPAHAGAMEAFFGGEASELVEAHWLWTRTGFPYTFVGEKEGLEVRPVFYEAMWGRKSTFGDKEKHSRARAFTFSDDQVKEIGSYERRPGQSPTIESAHSADLSLYYLENGPDFQFALRRIE